MSEITITQANFQEMVLGSDKPVLLDFWAPWCGPCRMVAPIVAALAEEREDIIVGKVNIDDEVVLAMEQRVVSIPTLMVFKGGKMTAKTVGFCSRKEIEALLEK